mmetsp:Transcript_12984/g.24989  ORF Transcript_12984/g.24989 Transcript_12984/m.24989 type:complete len:173 (-) Transcript_12984:681-1199(-)
MFSSKAGDGEPLIKSLFLLLLTSEVPTEKQADSLLEELHKRAALPPHVRPLMDSLKNMHPIKQLTIGVNACQTESSFHKAYAAGVSKNKYHNYVLEDILDCVATLPELAAIIYCNLYFDSVINKDTSLDYSTFAVCWGSITLCLMNLCICICIFISITKVVTPRCIQHTWLN